MAEANVQTLQAAAEGVEIVGAGGKVTFLGEEYRIAEKIGQMPLLKFASAAEQGMDSSDMAGYAAMYALIRDCVDPSDWARFERDAINKKADGDDLFKVVTDVIAVLAARPTRRPSDSSAGPPTTSAPSKVTSSSTVPAARNVPADQDMGELVSISDLLESRRLTA